jgi:serine/threonine protein phosphatase PrpC
VRYIATADTDVGITKQINQDSLLIKHGKYDGGEIMMAVICDGMGGLAKGEVASATVIKRFARWFDEELPYELANVDMGIIGAKWELLIRELNATIYQHVTPLKLSMGTTFTGVLFINDDFLVVHVGDTRLYKIDSSIIQMTEDQTFIAQEIRAGRMTPEQAKVDKRRNMLLQCIGASDSVMPQIITGKATKGTYMLCSDGFRHEISPKEMYESLNPVNLINKEAMHANAKYLIEQVKRRREKDNISVILIKAY